MKNFKIIALFVFLCCSFFYGTAQKKKGKVPPNIVIIISDDHAFQTISAYGGNLMKTPNIDRLANEGVVFNNAFVTNSICGPSRAVLLSGKYSHKNGFKDNVTAEFDGSQDSFIKQLTNSGYQTAWIGKWHLGSQPQGFSYWKILPGQGEYYNPDFLTMGGGKEQITGYVSNIVEDLSEEWLDKRDKTKPFCIVIGHKATHRTWLADSQDFGAFDDVTFPLPLNFYDNYSGREAAKIQEMSIYKDMRMGYDLKMFDNQEQANKEGNLKRMNAEQRKKFDDYYTPINTAFNSQKLEGNELAEWKYQRYQKDYLSTAKSLDRNIGRTLDYLDKNKLAENTIVIYMSDQGFYMGEHGWFDKRFMYEESFKTPMLMRFPKKIRPGTVSNNFVMNLDVAPTVLDAANVAIPKEMQGQSMLSLFTDRAAVGREAVYYHYYENGEHAVSPHFGVRNSRYKLIRFYQKVNSWELYDLERDPFEMTNLFGKDDYRQVTQDMLTQLNVLIEKYEDEDAKKVLFSE